MNPWILYLITRCDNIRVGGGSLLFISVLVSFVLWGCYFAALDAKNVKILPTLRKVLAGVGCLNILAIALLICVPTTREAAKIYGVPVMVSGGITSNDLQELDKFVEEDQKIRLDNPK
jgi:hypothetical protein